MPCARRLGRDERSVGKRLLDFVPALFVRMTPLVQEPRCSVRTGLWCHVGHPRACGEDELGHIESVAERGVTPALRGASAWFADT
jgi:hypothetical protein